MGLWETIENASFTFAQKSPENRGAIGELEKGALRLIFVATSHNLRGKPFLSLPGKTGQTDRSVSAGGSGSKSFSDCGIVGRFFHNPAETPCFSGVFSLSKNPKIAYRQLFLAICYL